MKTTLIKLLSVVWVLAAVSCSKAEPDNPKQPEQPALSEYCDFKFNMGGEFTATVSYDSLTKSQDGDLYAVIIHQVGGADVFSGIFDDPAKMSLKLRKDSKYKVTATVIKNGKTKLGKKDGAYKEPFKESGAQVTNAFIDGTNACSMTYIQDSKAYVNRTNEQMEGSGYEVFEIPYLDRYYGECSIDNPSAGSATIVLKRVSFGLEVVATGEMAKNGYLIMNINHYRDGGQDKAPHLVLSLTDAQEDKISEIYTLPGVLPNIEESLNLSISIQFVPNNNNEGITSKSINVSTEVKRNKKTTVNVQLNSTTASNSISVQYADGEEGDMENGSSNTAILWI